MSREDIDHEPVLAGPVLNELAPRAGETVVDATLGHGGHSLLLAKAIGETGRLIGLDVDEQNLQRAKGRLRDASLLSGGPHVDLVRGNFNELDHILDDLCVGQIDVLLADLGVSTDQLLSETLGLTFTKSAPLDMRLDDRLTTTAEDLVNRMTENELADLIFHNSQERFSRRIAKRICQARRDARIRTTDELVRIVCGALHVSPETHRHKIHPATRTFLALRMAVNDEMNSLKRLLDSAARRLAIDGRIAVISFHSGEDRIVKRDFLARQKAGVYQVLTKKPIRPSSEEVRSNPRSRSAKLRAAMRSSGTRDAA